MRFVPRSVIALIPLALACVAPASAAAAFTPNACQYSFDGWFRDVPVSVAGEPAIVPDPPRYPAPTEVVPGQQIELDDGLLDVALPNDLATTGAQVGLLQPGLNEVPVRIWVAIEGSNTLEGVQVRGPLAVMASTTITYNPVEESYSATPWEYDAPPIPAMTWTAVGGDVQFRQAGPGTLGDLPVGPGGASRSVAGSVLIRADLPGGLFMNMDCQPGITGASTGGETLEITPRRAAPFGAVAGPQNLTCLGDLGRQASGAAADLPDGLDREIDPLEGALSASGAATYKPGSPYVLNKTRLRFVIAPGTAATFGRFTDGGDPLVVPDEPYPLTVWVLIAASNTVEGVQLVRAETTYSLHPATLPPGPTTPWDARALVVDLPSTTWTPSAGGRPIEFTLAPPRSMAPIVLAGPAVGGPGGPVVGATFSAHPYGSVVLRAGTERNATTLDCVPGAVSIANGGVGWSNLGRLAPPNGSGGRYGLVAHPRPPVIVRATAVPPPPVVPPPPPPPPPAGPPPPGGGPDEPTAGKARLASTRLVRKRGRIRLTLRCPAAGGPCAGRVAIRTARKVRAGKRRKVVTIVPARRFAIASGKRKTLKLAPSRQGRRLLAGRRRALRVRVVLRTGSGRPKTTRPLTLRP